MPEPQMQYMVSVDLVVPISGISFQPHYVYGPFVGQDATEAFIGKVNASTKFRCTGVNVLNPPRLFGTGRESCLDPC
jgi:hypothetical protein